MTLLLQFQSAIRSIEAQTNEQCFIMLEVLSVGLKNSVHTKPSRVQNRISHLWVATGVDLAAVPTCSLLLLHFFNNTSQTDSVNMMNNQGRGYELFFFKSRHWRWKMLMITEGQNTASVSKASCSCRSLMFSCCQVQAVPAIVEQKKKQ